MSLDPSALTRAELTGLIKAAFIEDNDRPSPARRAGAVMVIFLETDQGPALLFTKRAAHLDEHPGQISFPGGGVEDDDPNLESAAARETLEEIGIKRNELAIIGQLPPQPVLDHWLIHPFAAWWGNPRRLEPSAAEVERIIIVPLAELWAQHRQGCWNIPDPEKSCRYLISGEVLWGATARITGRLLDSFIALRS